MQYAFTLAFLYGVETRRLNEQVKRNIERFPSDFMFQLTKEEFDFLMSQIAISKWGGTRKLPYAFTRNGVAMLSSVLRSQTAVGVNVKIMRVFTAIPQLVNNNAQIIQNVVIIIKRNISNLSQNNS
ncbi:ORF6N domain-containing protein [Segatella bryantii]|nr:ORF6N domain-containing protein [Segatella bryantii]